MFDTRSIYWENDQICMINQIVLPGEFRIERYDTWQDVVTAIKTMVIRGAPAIGAAAAFGMAIAARNSTASSVDAMQSDLQVAHDQLAASRPTAVNLFWALKRMAKLVHGKPWGGAHELRDALLHEAQCIADEDVEVNKRMGAYGAALVPDKATINTHCNAGSLATVFWGTALGVVRSAWEQGKDIHVFVDETRPRLQGARLTAWELRQLGIPHTVFSDGASGHNMRRRGVDLCLVGSDRIAANGDVANKIGTYNLAVVAKENGVPFYVVAPWSTVDMSLMHGDLIPIEERSEDEVTLVEGARLTPDGSPAGNPAFDVTPNYLVSGIVTEYGVLRQPYAVSLRKLADQIEGDAG